MRKTVITAIATCVGPLILALGVAAPAAWADCSSGCGGANPDNPGNAQGGRITTSNPKVGTEGSVSGTFAVPGGQTTGHVAQTSTFGDASNMGTASGNFNSLTPPIPGPPPTPSSKGHCSGLAFQSFCS
jgi:hypothetical protein